MPRTPVEITPSNAVIEAEQRREQMVENALVSRFGNEGRAVSEWYHAHDLERGMERPSMLAVMKEREAAGRHK